MASTTSTAVTRRTRSLPHGRMVEPLDTAYAALLAAVDQLAVVRAAYLAGTASYREYAEATDAVIRAREAAGVDLRIADLEQQAEQRAELSLSEVRDDQ